MSASSFFLLCRLLVLFMFFFVGRTDAKKETGTSSVVVVAPVATTEDDDDEDDATINKWSKFRVKALKFNESTYFGYIVLAIIFIGSIALVRDETNTSLNCVHGHMAVANPEIGIQPPNKTKTKKTHRRKNEIKKKQKATDKCNEN